MGELRVLMIAPTPFFSDRGCHVRILEEIRALQSKGARILLVTYPNGADAENIQIARVGKWTGYDKDEAGPSWIKPFLDVLLFSETLKQARIFKPHIIHAHLHEGCLAGWPVAWWRRIPMVFDYQGGLARELAHHGLFDEGGGGFRFFKALESFIDTLPDAVLPSAGIFIDGIKKSKAKILPVMDALSPAEFTGRDTGETRGLNPLSRNFHDCDEIKARFNIGAGRFVVVYLGLLNTYQGTGLLIDVIKELKNRGREEFLFMMMGYPNVGIYKEIARREGLADMVRFTGRVPYKDAGKYISVGHAAVAPKLASTESNGKVLDYMACGIPTVALDTPVNRELMGDAGLFVKWEGDTDKATTAFADELIRLADDKKLRDRLSKLGSKRVKDMFSREKLAGRLVEVYRDVLGDRFPVE